jgi:hypothetical protein
MDGCGNGHRDPALSPPELDRRKPYKPLDVGNGIVSGSLSPSGRWLSLGIAHPVHGRVELTTAPPFTGDRLRQSAVRAYRAALADSTRQSFGFDLLDDEASSVSLIADSFPFAVVERPEGRFEVTTVAPKGRAGAVQLLRMSARSNIVGPSWSGAMRLARAEYTQLTAGDALPPASSAYASGMNNTVFWIDDRALGAAAAVAQSDPLVVAAGSEAQLVLAVALAGTRVAAIRDARALAHDGEALVAAALEERRRIWQGWRAEADTEAPIRRGVAYAMDCAASRIWNNLDSVWSRDGISVGSVAVLADHQILPLVWTRDAYYVCRALLSVAPTDPDVDEIVGGFVDLLFANAVRPWGRALLANGTAKDRAFQLDQQVYPPLLIADWALAIGRPALLDAWRGECEGVIEGLLARRTEEGLIATEETPGDDPLAQPFHFSSHVLLWHLLDRFGHPAAAAVRDTTLKHFTSEGRFAYAITGPDGAGARHYHDANDLPTVFAPGWGFCGADDPRWRATIEFAWSDANEGYFAGTLGGLGSVHTPHPWPLGDLQEIVVARVTNDPARELRAKERLARVETWDGMLPEAYDETSGAVASRHWFAWPAALRALLEREPMLTAP